MLRYLVRILHPQIFSLSSVVGHFLKKSEFNVFMDRSVVKSEVEPTMNGKCVSND